MKIKNIILLVVIVISAKTYAQTTTKIEFTFKAAYNWAETRDIIDQELGLFTKSGTVAGSWSWDFDNGQKGNTHFIVFFPK